MNAIDFSGKHDILLEDEQGLCVPMDEPYFRAKEIAKGTWQVLSDGDYSYLLEGDEEALVIDSGYGAGNIREFCQTLTDKPVRRIANTHDHFDHTANNCYFECAYMAEETKPLAGIAFPSFSGIQFPREYPVVIVGDGDRIPLAGRDLTVIKIPDHAVGSLAFLDTRERILFAGDELGMPMGKTLRCSVENWAELMDKLLQYRSAYDRIFGGGGQVESDIAERYLDNVKQILEGKEGRKAEAIPFPNFEKLDEQGRRIWKRRLPHPGDGPKPDQEKEAHLLMMEYAGCKIIYDSRCVRNVQHADGCKG